MSFRKINLTNQNTTDTGFSDPLVILNKDAASDVSDVGFLAKTAASTYTGLFRDSGTKEYYLIHNYTSLSGNDANPANVTLAPINVGSMKVNGDTVATQAWVQGQTYMTSYTETDPVFTASPAYSITNTDKTNWNTAFGWGNHNAAGYATQSWVTGQGYLTGITNQQLESLSNVTLTSPTTGQVLKYNGTVWVNDTDLTGSAGSISWGDISGTLADQTDLNAKLVITESYVSSDITIVSGGSVQLTHGLSTKPVLVEFLLKCVTAEANYSVNDEVILSHSESIAAVSDSTYINLRLNSDTNVFTLPNFSTGSATLLTNANWKLIVKAWA